MGSIEEPISRGEYRRKETEILFGIELLLYRWGLSEFIFDEERQVFCDENGSAVLSRHQADRERLFGGDESEVDLPKASLRSSGFWVSAGQASEV